MTTGFDHNTQFLNLSRHDSTSIMDPLDEARLKLNQLGVVAEDFPLDTSTIENMQQISMNNLTLLPDIKGPVKTVRQLLMQDLEADGVIKRHVPFSKKRSKAELMGSPSGLLSKRSSAALPNLKASPSLSSI